MIIIIIVTIILLITIIIIKKNKKLFCNNNYNTNLTKYNNNIDDDDDDNNNNTKTCSTHYTYYGKVTAQSAYKGSYTIQDKMAQFQRTTLVMTINTHSGNLLFTLIPHVPP